MASKFSTTLFHLIAHMRLNNASCIEQHSLLTLAQRGEERMVSPEHHALTPRSTVCEDSSRSSCLIATRSRDHLADKAKLLGAIRYGVEPDVSQVRSGVVLEAVLHDGIVFYTGSQTRRQLWESTS